MVSRGFLVSWIKKCVSVAARSCALTEVQMFTSASQPCWQPVWLNHHRGDTPSRCPSPHLNPSRLAWGWRALPLCGPADTPARPGCWSRCALDRGGSGPPGRPPPPTASNRSPFEAVRPQRRRRQVHPSPADQRVWGRAGWAARPGRWQPSGRGRRRNRR